MEPISHNHLQLILSPKEDKHKYDLRAAEQATTSAALPLSSRSLRKCGTWKPHGWKHLRPHHLVLFNTRQWIRPPGFGHCMILQLDLAICGLFILLDHFEGIFFFDCHLMKESILHFPKATICTCWFSLELLGLYWINLGPFLVQYWLQLYRINMYKRQKKNHYIWKSTNPLPKPSVCHFFVCVCPQSVAMETCSIQAHSWPLG